MKSLNLFQPWSLGAAVLTVGVLICGSLTGSVVVAASTARGLEPHIIVTLLDPSWCIPAAIVLAVAMMAKDIWCPARVAIRLNLVTFLTVLLLGCVYFWAVFQPGRWVLPKH